MARKPSNDSDKVTSKTGQKITKRNAFRDPATQITMCKKCYGTVFKLRSDGLVICDDPICNAKYTYVTALESWVPVGKRRRPRNIDYNDIVE